MQIPTNLVLDWEGYKVSHTLEFETFSHLLKKKAQKGTGYLQHADWDRCLREIQSLYHASNMIKEVEESINLFSSSRDHYYLPDWQEYLRSLRESDLVIQDVERVWFSTMHKSKGQEFNTVFLYLDNLELKTPADFRLLYVALTRVQEHLHVYTNAHELKASIGEYGNWIEHSDPDYELNAIQLQFGLKHVNLGRMKHNTIQDSMRSLHSGAVIALDANYQSALFPDGRKIPLSNFANEKLSTWTARGYTHEMTLLDRIVIWRDINEADDRSYRVPVLRVHLRKEDPEK